MLIQLTSRNSSVERMTMDSDLKLLWGDTHHNSYQHYVQDPSLAELLEFCSTYLDFYTGAYYTPAFEQAGMLPEVDTSVEGLQGGHLSEKQSDDNAWAGVHLEALKDLSAMEAEWREFQEATRQWRIPGQFIAFPGFEWQGNGRWGDVNVTYREEGRPIITVPTISQLYDTLRGTDSIAIPHHTGYYVGQRAPRWEACDDTLSPYAEVFSIHGCSETDEELIGLRQNAHMGPGAGGGTYQDALDRGLHLGAICSTDNWTNMPGHWGHGLMGCWSREQSRDGLWDAFLSRRVYGVTGDRIQLEFSCNDAPMGSILGSQKVRRLRVDVQGWDEIDRIEILRNGRLLATHCHQGTWELPPDGITTRYRFRVECGWGPRIGEIPRGDQLWDGKIRLGKGRFLGWSPAWVVRGQGVPRLDGAEASFHMLSSQAYVMRESQGATLFEFEATSESDLNLVLNGLEASGVVRDFCRASRLLWYKDDCVDLVRRTTGVTPETARRGDVYYQMANKAKLHKAVPEAAFRATFEIEDDEPLTRETHYRVRVEQRNGQRAWSSPIWVAGEEDK